jgi:hypothetical protein
MTRRLAIFLTPLLLMAGSAAAQNAAAIVQQIHDQAYGKCMADAKFGAGGELQENCSCSADVVLDLLSEEFKHALADGTQASFTGAKLKGGEMERDVALLKTCPKIGTYLTQQCAGDPGNPHCQILERALQQAQ